MTSAIAHFPARAFFVRFRQLLIICSHGLQASLHSNTSVSFSFSGGLLITRGFERCNSYAQYSSLLLEHRCR